MSSRTPRSPSSAPPAGGEGPGGDPRAWLQTFSALAERDFAWYFVGNFAFFMAMQMNILLRGYLAYDLTGAAGAIGIISITLAVPMLGVAPLAGVIADRVNKRTLLMLTQAGMAGFNALMAFLILTGLVEFWHLLGASLGSGIVFAMIMPTRQALVPQLVPQHKLMNAISLQMGGMNLTRIAGPAIAGLLIAPIGIGWVYVVTVVLFMTAVATVIPLPIHGMVANEHPKRFIEDLSGGFQFIAQRPLFRLLIATALVMPLFAIPVQHILPVFQEEVFELGPSSLGILYGAAGVGGVIGALIAANLDRVAMKGRVMLVGAVLMGIAFIAFAQTPMFGLALVFLAVGNIGSMLFMTTNNTVIQARVSPEYRGRVMSVLMMSFGLQPLGVVPVSFASDAIGAPWAVTISSALLLLTAVAFFTLSRRLRDLNLAALGRAELSPAQAAQAVAEGRLTKEEAARLSGGLEAVEAAAEEREMEAVAGTRGRSTAG